MKSTQNKLTQSNWPSRSSSCWCPRCARPRWWRRCSPSSSPPSACVCTGGTSAAPQPQYFCRGGSSAWSNCPALASGGDCSSPCEQSSWIQFEQRVSESLPWGEPRRVGCVILSCWKKEKRRKPRCYFKPLWFFYCATPCVSIKVLHKSILQWSSMVFHPLSIHLPTYLQFLVFLVQVGGFLRHQPDAVERKGCRNATLAGPLIPLVTLAAQNSQHFRPKDQRYRDGCAELGPKEAQQIFDVGAGLGEEE